MEEQSTDILQQSRHHISNSGALLLIRLIAGLFLIESAYAVLVFLTTSEPLENIQRIAVHLLWLAQTLKFFVELGIVIAIVVPWASTNYYISDGELIRYVGLRRRDETIFSLANLKSIELHQSWLGRIFNFGDVTLTFSSSGYAEKTTIYGVYNPKKYERHLNERLESS